jgi:undecaprenyl-diphosphatase
MFAWNVALFQRINATAATPHALIALANVIAQWTIWLIPMWLTVSWFRSDAQGRRELLEVLAVTLLALGFGQAIGMAWPQPRPFMVHVGTPFLAHVPDPGFPSDHVTTFWSVACAALASRRFARFGLVWFGLGLLVGWSRVFLGVHFPMDVFAALPVAVVATACVHALRRPMQPVYTQVEKLWERLSRARRRA